MTLDALAVRRLRDDLRDNLLDARIDKVLHPAENALALDTYGRAGRWQLILSVSPRAPAAFVTRSRFGRQDERTSPLLLLARKHCRGGRIRGIDQVDFDRVLVFDIEQRDEGAIARVRLIVELTGRLANLVLADESGMIHDALRRVPGTINRVRTLMPKARYVSPPATKPALDAISPAELRRLDRAAAVQPAWRVAVDAFAGVSPLLAREAVFRVGGDVDATVTETSLSAVFDMLRALVDASIARVEPVTGAWERNRLVAFAPYAITHLPNVQPAASISSLIAVSHAQGAVPAGIESRRGRLLERVDGLVGRQRRIVADLAAAIERSREAARVRSEAELLLAFQHEIQPGQRELQVGDVTIALEPHESVLDQAQQRFRQYHKLRSIEQELPARLNAVQAMIEVIETLRVHVETAVTAAELQAVEAELVAIGHDAAGSARSKQPIRGAGRRRRTPGTNPAPAVGQRDLDGWTVLFGRTAGQNARVTFDLASPDDLWLHARGVAGAHVVLRTNRREPPDAVIERAAALAASLSGARRAAKVDVDVTAVRNVRKRPGAGPGMVSYRNERTINVEPMAPGPDNWHDS